MGTSLKIRALSYEKNTDGLMPIKLVLTIDRKTRKYHLQKFVHPDHWIGKPPEFVKNSGRNSHPNARYLNLHLSNRMAEAQRIILKFEEENIVPSFKEFKAKFLGLEKQSFFDWHEKYVENQIRDNVGKATVSNYQSQAKKLKSFRKEIALKQITYDFVKDYAHFLKENRQNDDNTIYKSLVYFRAVFKFAKKKKAISGDPFEDIIMEQHVKPATYLIKREVDNLLKLYKSKIIKESWQNVLGMFLWACNTGQAYSDAVAVRYSDIIQVGEHVGLSNKRYKTKVKYFVPLFEEALYLLGDMPIDRDQLIFNSISNQKTNQYLKEIVKIVGITKRVTFHTGRHSFGHSLIRKGVDRSYIKEILGHSSEIMTRHYSQVMNIDVINNLKDKWYEE